MCAVRVCLGYFNCPLSLEKAEKGTCHTLGQFALGEKYLWYFIYTEINVQICFHTPRYLNSPWLWLTFTHACLHTWFFTPLFLVLHSLSNIRTYSSCVCYEQKESRKRWRMSQIMSDWRQHPSNASLGPRCARTGWRFYGCCPNINTSWKSVVEKMSVVKKKRGGGDCTFCRNWMLMLWRKFRLGSIRFSSKLSVNSILQAVSILLYTRPTVTHTNSWITCFWLVPPAQASLSVQHFKS